MAITYTWGIEKMRVNQVPQTDFVTDISFRVVGVDGDYTAKSEGKYSDLEAGDSFIAFADLTEAQVVTWVKNSLGSDGVSEHENHVANIILVKKTPPVPTKAIKTLPW